jgi:hypothetical protein
LLPTWVSVSLPFFLFRFFPQWVILRLYIHPFCVHLSLPPPLLSLDTCVILSGMRRYQREKANGVNYPVIGDLSSGLADLVIIWAM